MLPRENRLTQRKDFTEVKLSGTKYQGRLFNLAVLINNNSLPIRFGLVVGKKIFPRAVDRNRAKRLIRGEIRHLLSFLIAGADVVILFKRPLLDVPLQEIAKNLRNLLEESGLFIRNNNSHD